MGKCLFLPTVSQKLETLLPLILTVPSLRSSLEQGNPLVWMQILLQTHLELQDTVGGHHFRHDQRNAARIQKRLDIPHTDHLVEEMAGAK